MTTHDPATVEKADVGPKTLEAIAFVLHRAGLSQTRRQPVEAARAVLDVLTSEGWGKGAGVEHGVLLANGASDARGNADDAAQIARRTGATHVVRPVGAWQPYEEGKS